MKHHFPIDCSRIEPTKKLLGVSTPAYSVDILDPHPGSGYLQFWTVSITLRLDSAAPLDEVDFDSHRTPLSQRLGIYGRTGHELGTMMVHKAWIELNSIPVEREFILLCEGRDKRAENGRIDDEDGWRYMVMLIDWKQDGEYAERVAIGSIGKGDLDEGFGDGVMWKEIVLG